MKTFRRDSYFALIPCYLVKGIVWLDIGDAIGLLSGHDDEEQEEGDDLEGLLIDKDISRDDKF